MNDFISKNLDAIRQCLNSETTEEQYNILLYGDNIITTRRKEKYTPLLVRQHITNGFNCASRTPEEANRIISQYPEDVHDWIHWLLRSEKKG